MDSKVLYSCETCHVVDKQEIIKRRIDQEFEMFARGSGQWEMHGYKIYRVCKHCEEIKVVCFISDCKLGYCGVKKAHYGGGEHHKCPECKNEFSFGNNTSGVEPDVEK